MCLSCLQTRGVGCWCNSRVCRLLAYLSRRIKSTFSARLVTVTSYSVSLSALPIVVLITYHDEPSPSVALHYWPVSCVMALSSITLFLGTSCYIKLSLMVSATVAYNVVGYVTSGHMFYNDNMSTQ